MKKNWMLLLFFPLVSLSAFTGCNDDVDDLPENTHLVSKEVQDAFNSKYPQARDVEWELRGIYAVVDFDWNGSDHSAWFDPASALWYMTETDLRYADLPQAVRQAHETGEYAAWHRDDVDMLTREGMETLYVIEVENGNTDMDLFYSPSGVLVKNVADTGQGGSYDEYLPNPDVQGITDLVRQKYPNAHIIEIDRENGMTEVEILDEKVCRDVYFNNSGDWLYTKTEISPYAVPESVKSALAASAYASYRIDDVDFYETAEKSYYRYDLDSRDGDVKVDISADGTSLTVVGGNGGDNTPGGDMSGSMVGTDLKSWIEKKYPGAVIWEREYEHGLLEVTVWHENKEKEVYFNGRNEWVRTTWDVHVMQLPEKVRQAVRTRYPEYMIDDADYVEASSGTWYELELEDRMDRDFNVRIGADGSWME